MLFMTGGEHNTVAAGNLICIHLTTVFSALSVEAIELCALLEVSGISIAAGYRWCEACDYGTCVGQQGRSMGRISLGLLQDYSGRAPQRSFLMGFLRDSSGLAAVRSVPALDRISTRYAMWATAQPTPGDFPVANRSPGPLDPQSVRPGNGMVSCY